MGHQGVQYAFTLTLKPSLFSQTAESQFDATKDAVLLALARIATRFSLIGALTKTANLHYHGIIEFGPGNASNTKLFYDTFRKVSSIGRMINITQIDDYPGWIDYLTKNLRESRSLSRPALIHDQHGIGGTDSH